MQPDQVNFLTDDIGGINSKERRQLLPWWIKVFMWLFLILGAFVPLILILGLMGYSIQLALYGLETNRPLSLIGFIINILFLIKAITSFGLLKQKNWAIKLGIIDSAIGILICIGLMIYAIIVTDLKVVFRIELVLLIPYLRKLLKIKSDWENTIRI